MVRVRFSGNGMFGITFSDRNVVTGSTKYVHSGMNLTLKNAAKDSKNILQNNLLFVFHGRNKLRVFLNGHYASINGNGKVGHERPIFPCVGK